MIGIWAGPGFQENAELLMKLNGEISREELTEMSSNSLLPLIDSPSINER